MQRPHPPILIGGGGKRVLSIAGRQADIVGINATLSSGVVDADAISTMTAAAVEEKLAVVREAAAARIDDIELSIRTFFVSVTDDRQRAVDEMAAFAGVDEETIAESPFAMIGSAAQIVDNLLARRERFGFSYVTVGGEDVVPLAPVVAELRGR